MVDGAWEVVRVECGVVSVGGADSSGKEAAGSNSNLKL